MNFRSSLEELFNEEINRLRDVDVNQLWTSLSEALLTPDEIDKAVTTELIRVAGLTYETIQNSDRMEGFGWSTTKIKEHMRRFVSLKIQQLVHLLRNGKPLQTTTKEFTAYVDELQNRDI